MCANCEWEEYAEIVDELLESDDAQWAEETLLGIQEWVLANSHVTPGQIDAVNNIKNAVERRRGEG